MLNFFWVQVNLIREWYVFTLHCICFEKVNIFLIQSTFIINYIISSCIQNGHDIIWVIFFPIIYTPILLL